MFTKEPNSNELGLQEAIDRVLNDMKMFGPDTAEYAMMADRLEQLYKLKEIDSKKRVSRETLVNIAANIGGIAMILFHEHSHVVTSKALGFVKKLK